jgi:hypothetical protein
VLAVGVSIIARGGPKYNIIINKLRTNEQREDRSVVLMEYVSGAVADRVYDHWDIRDEFLGWASRSFNTPIITKANTLLLLDILWTDRRGFLRAWADTKAPGLGGLMFLLWRCVQITK